MPPRALVRRNGNRVSRYFTPTSVRAAATVGRYAGTAARRGARMIQKAWRNYKARKSYKRAKTSTERRYVNMNEGANGTVENGKFTLYKKPQKGAYKKGNFQSTWDYTNTSTIRLQGAIGALSVLNLDWIFDGADLLAIYQKVAASLTTPLSVGGSNAFAQLYINKCVKTTHIVNMDNFNATIWVYTLIPRQNFMQALNPALGVDPVSLGNYDTNNIYHGAVNIAPSVIGWTPYSSPSITKFYNIKKCNKYVLKPGEKIEYKTQVFSNKAFRADTFTSANAMQIAMWGGLTTCQMVIAQGAIVNDANTKAIISTSKPVLDILEVSKYDGKWSIGNWKQSFNATTLPTSSTLVTPQGINEQSGDVETEAAA
jgi:hypothetical protein